MASAPAWKSMQGPRRVQAEYKHLNSDIRQNKFGFIKELSLPSDDMNVWHLKLWKFDDDLPGGKQLNEDLQRLKQQYGQDYLLMEIKFPDDYPHKPFFVRLVSPRCVMYTGHVTAGGSICLEALTCSGTPGSWQPDFTVESLMNVIVINMIDCPVTYVQTATGPGGRSGPLRIDFSRGSPIRGYSSDEAVAAFQRTLANHQRFGWGHGDDNKGNKGSGKQSGAAAAAAAAGGGGAAGQYLLLPNGPPPGFGMGGSSAAAAAAYAAGISVRTLPSARSTNPPSGGAAAVLTAAKRMLGGAAAAAAAGVPGAAPPPPAAADQAQGPTGGTGGTRKQAPAAAPPLRRMKLWHGGPSSHTADVVDLTGTAPAAAAAAPPAATPAAAAAAAGGGSDAGDGGGGQQGRQKRRKPSQPASSQAAVIDLCDSDDDSDGVCILPAGKAPARDPRRAAAAGGSASARRAAVVAAAAGGPAARAPPPSAAAARAGGPAGNVPAAAAAAGAGDAAGRAAAAAGRSSVPERKTKPAPAAAVVVVADDSDDDSVQAQAGVISPPRQRRAPLHQQQQQQDVQGSRPQRQAAVAARQAMSPPTRSQSASAKQQRHAAILASVKAAQQQLMAQMAGAPAAAAGGGGGAAAAAGASTKVAKVKAALAKRRGSRSNPQAAAAAAVPVPHLEVSAAVQEQVVVGGGNGVPKVQLELELPAHWDYRFPMQRDTIRFIELPLDRNPAGGSALPQDPLELAAAAAGVDENNVAMLTQQGLSRADALAALLLELQDGASGGDPLLRAVTCMDLGGAAKVWADMQPLRDVDGVLQASEAEANAQALAQEAERILQLLTNSGGGKLTRQKVIKVERIQHAKLWRRFALRRSELLDARGRAGLNERMLFHGTSPGTADRIVQEGFDMRLVNHSSAYGNGVYFADHSSTAYDYCLRPDNAAAAQGFGAGGAAGWARMAMPPPPGLMGGPAAFMAAMGLQTMGGNVTVTTNTFVNGVQVGHTHVNQQGGPVYKMVIARVALGQQAVGQAGMRRPPDGYDSVNSGRAGHATASNPYCHVIFDNDQAYPEYLVTLRP